MRLLYNLAAVIPTKSGCRFESYSRSKSHLEISGGDFSFMPYYLYILQSEINHKFYVGSSENPKRRLICHNSIEKGFTARYRPWKLVFMKEFTSKSIAQKTERKVKSWKSRLMIERLIKDEITI